MKILAYPPILRHEYVRKQDSCPGIQRTSTIVNSALRMTPSINISRKRRWRRTWRFVSNMDRRINPAPPRSALKTASVPQTRSLVLILGIKLYLGERMKQSQDYSEPSGMSKPSLDEETEEEGDCCNDAPNNEQWPEDISSNVRYVGDFPVH